MTKEKDILDILKSIPKEEIENIKKDLQLLLKEYNKIQNLSIAMITTDSVGESIVCDYLEKNLLFLTARKSKSATSSAVGDILKNLIKIIVYIKNKIYTRPIVEKYRHTFDTFKIFSKSFHLFYNNLYKIIEGINCFTIETRQDGIKLIIFNEVILSAFIKFFRPKIITIVANQQN